MINLGAPCIASNQHILTASQFLIYPPHKLHFHYMRVVQTELHAGSVEGRRTDLTRQPSSDVLQLTKF